MDRDSLAVAALLALSVLLSIATSSAAAENAAPGAGNALAIEISGKSALVRSAKELIDRRIREMQNAQLRSATEDAVDNPATCVRHRAGIDAATKAAIIARLKSEGLVDPEDYSRFASGLSAGIFPPLKADDGDCPQLPQAFTSAPGGVFGGHHSYPGGLAIHEAFNLSSALSFATNYRRTYGHRGASGLPEIGPVDNSEAANDIAIDQDMMIAAPIWHDWAKTIVFQWTETGDEFPEFNFGGNGKTDKFGGVGNSKTGAHHILGIAETIKRGLPTQFVIIQASAHAAPAEGNEFMVVNWIRAAAVIAQVDPVTAGYLIKDSQGRRRLPPLRRLADLPIQQSLPDEPNLIVEYTLHNLSDADHTFTGSALSEVQIVLKTVAGRFGYDPTDAAVYNTRFRNVVLAHLSAERHPLCGRRRRRSSRRNRTIEAGRDYLKHCRSNSIVGLG
jgi:hypothetical protein